MFDNDFINSLKRMEGQYLNECYKGRYDNKDYFVKKITLRYNEDLSDALRRIEYSEHINQLFHQNGLNTVLPICFNGSYCCIEGNNIWIAYPWIDINGPDVKNLDHCFKIGKLLGYIHQISSRIKCDENFDLEEFESLQNIETCLDEYKDLFDFYKYGYECKEKLYKECTPILSHNDIHSGNLSFKDDQFIVFDWELSGIGNCYSEVFDTALNICGFCECQSDINRFRSFVEGYYSVYDLKKDKQLFRYAIGHIYYEIIKHIFIHLNNDKAVYFLNQFNELRRLENLFLKALMSEEV